MNRSLTKTQIVILAGGKGTRLKPLTDTVPKPMIKIEGIPFLEILLRFLNSKGFTNFVLCVGHLSDVIQNHFLNGNHLGINIEYSTESQQLGTAGAIKNASNLLEKEFLLVNGDTFIDMDFQKLIEFAHKNKKLCTMTVFHGYNSSDFQNNLFLDKDSLVCKYSKDKKLKELNFVDAGMYFLKKNVLDLFENNGFLSLEYEIFPKLIEKKQLAGFPINSRFYDIGSFSKMEKFKEMIKKLGTANI